MVGQLEMMMHKLGQNPTKHELNELINSVDEGDKDGQLQFREFVKLFTMGLDTKGDAKLSDATDCFMWLGGDPRDDDSRAQRPAVMLAISPSHARMESMLQHGGRSAACQPKERSNTPTHGGGAA